jgi:hypothetical protein
MHRFWQRGFAGLGRRRAPYAGPPWMHVGSRRMMRGHGHCGPGRAFREFDREEMLPRLEEYQKDLEQQLADVADLIRRLKEEKPETTTV